MSTRGYRGRSIYDTLDLYDSVRREAINNPYDPEGDPIDQTPTQIIPSYLEPIGNTGFFVTPDEPAEPWDCERFPTSPFCGGSGIDPVSVATIVPFDISPSFSSNECEACLQVDGTFFFIAVPPGHVCYRSKDPSCQPPPPPPPPPPGGGTPNFIPFNGPKLGKRCTGVLEISATFTYPDGRGSFQADFFDTDPIAQPMGLYAGGEGYATVGYVFLEFDKVQVGAFQPVSVDVKGIKRFIPSNPADPECQPVDDDNNGYEPPPPPPLDRRCPCMSCCQPSDNDDNNELLRLIARRLGAYDYPISTPRWLVTNQGESSIPHQSLTELLLWTVQQMDALAGEFPIKVEIEDSDPTKEGNQTKSVELPNIAETLAEIYGLSAKTAIDGDMHTSFLMRLAVEMIATKTAALIAQDYASANASFLGYKGNEVKRSVQFAFNPEGSESIEEILKEKSYSIKGWRNEDRDSVADYLQRIMFASGVLKSVFFRRKQDLERVIAGLKDFVPGSGGGSRSGMGIFPEIHQQS